MDTPARNTRARSKTPGPLPAINPKQSHAYGAQGKTDLQKQVKSTSTDFAQEFQSTRKRASNKAPAVDPVAETAEEEAEMEDEEVEEEEEEEQEEEGAKVTASPLPTISRTLRRTTTRRDDHPAATQGSVVETSVTRQTSGPNQSISHRDATHVDNVAQYLELERERRQRAAAAVSTPRSTENRRRAGTSSRTAAPAPPEQFQPTNIRDILVALFGFTLILLLLGALPLPKYAQDFLGLSVNQTTAAELMGRVGADDWRPVHQYVANRDFEQRIRTLEAQMKEVREHVGLHRDSIETLKALLPDTLAVNRDDGTWIVPPDFWTAITEKMSGEAGAPLWDAFINANADRMKSVIDGFKPLHDNDDSDGSTDIITKANFIRLIEKNNQMMHEEFTDRLEEAQRKVMAWAEKVATNIAEATVKKSPAYRLAELEIASLGVANYAHRVDQVVPFVNWFSVESGAIIHPKLTSSTKDPNGDKVVPWLFTRMFNLARPFPPITALREWFEHGDCWCSSPSTDGKAQLTVVTTKHIYPDRLFVEHPDPNLTSDISAAPRELEIWAEAESVSEAHAITDKVLSIVPQIERTECGRAPAPKFVCIGRGSYDIHLSPRQEFPTFVDTKSLGFATNKIAVRVKSNWGQEWTCLYRLLLSGERRVQPVQTVDDDVPPSTL